METDKVSFLVVSFVLSSELRGLYTSVNITSKECEALKL
jgi:hypothetical protein